MPLKVVRPRWIFPCTFVYIWEYFADPVLIKEFHFFRIFIHSTRFVRNTGAHRAPAGNTALLTCLKKKKVPRSSWSSCCAVGTRKVFISIVVCVHHKCSTVAYIFSLRSSLIMEPLYKARGACFTFFRAAFTLRVPPFSVRIPFIITTIFFIFRVR